MNDPVFERRRNRRLRNPDAPIYDERMIGGPDLSEVLETDPFDNDPTVRKEAYAAMGAFIREDLHRARGTGETFVERRSSPDRSSEPEAPRARPRPLVITPTTYRYTQEAEQEEYYDQESDYYESEYPDDDEDSDDEWQQPVQPTRVPGRQTPVRANSRSQGRYPEDDDYRTGRYPVRQGRPDRYPDQQPPPRRIARPAPEPQYRNNYPVPRATRPTQSPPRAPRQNQPRVSRAPRPAPPSPVQPALLAPDGSIPRHPCGVFLVTHLGDMQVSIECQEERRETTNTGLGYHPNMPHIARINDPYKNSATAFFVWNTEPVS